MRTSVFAGSQRRAFRFALAAAALGPGIAVTGDALAAGTAGQCGVITYCGGPVISNVQIVPVFWSDQVSTTITGWAEGYLSSLANSELLDMLSEYSTVGKTGEACAMSDNDGGISYFGPTTPFSTGQTVTRGTAVPAVTITPNNTSQNITDDNAVIGTEIIQQIQAGKLPAPTYDKQGYPNTIYFMFFPQSMTISAFGGQSCGSFGGYHYSVPYTASGCTGQYIPYAVIPDCGDSTKGLASVCSHELAEAISDSDVGPTTPAAANYGDGAWYLGPSYPCNSPQNCPSNCGEVGDVCQGQGDGTVPGTSIISQYIWSQAQNGCDVNNPSVGTQTGPGGLPVTVCTAPVPDAGTPTPDSGTPHVDSGVPHADGGSPPPDAGGVEPGADASLPPGRDASTGPGADDAGEGGAANGGLGDAPFASNSGCGCTTAPGAPGLAGTLGALAALGLAARRRRRS
jgi:MYXO-CTERM domain-containing protein